MNFYRGTTNFCYYEFLLYYRIIVTVGIVTPMLNLDRVRVAN